MSVVFYHWWDQRGDPPPYANIRSPIVLSIATLRAHNPSIPVYVIDGSQSFAATRENRHISDWGYFPDKLNFKVIEKPVKLAKNYNHRGGFIWLSRLFDLEDYHGNETVIYSDSDVFWFKDPEPLEKRPDKFCFDGHNTGFFYYHPEYSDVQRFFELFKAYTIAALNNEQIRSILKTYVGYDGWYYVFDEMTCTFMFNEHRDLFNKISCYEHAAVRSLHITKARNMKAFHCNGLMVPNVYPKNGGERNHSRGLLALIFQELYDIICQVLDQKDLDMIFSKQQLNYYLDQQFSLENNLGKLLWAKGTDGLFHIDKCLKSNAISMA